LLEAMKPQGADARLTIRRRPPPPAYHFFAVALRELPPISQGRRGVLVGRETSPLAMRVLRSAEPRRLGAKRPYGVPTGGSSNPSLSS